MRAKPNRKPAHLEYIGGKTHRQHIWEMFRMLQPVTRPRLVNELPAAIHPDTTRTYMASLATAGFVDGPDEDGVYRLIRDHGVEAPRVRKDGSLVTQGRAHENVWRTLRLLGRATDVRELTALADTPATPLSMSAVREFLNLLRQAGYLRQDGDRCALIRNTGPRPPMVQRLRRVYDLNLGQVVWTEEAGDE